MVRPALNTENLRAKLKLKHLASQSLLLAHHPNVKRLLASGALAGTLLLTPAQSLMSKASLPQPTEIALITSFDLQRAMAQKLAGVLPTEIKPLMPDQEKQISEELSSVFGIAATPELDGNRLNTDYGYIGVEQHLPLYPGDNRDNVTPGRGAWGYFAYSQNQLTDDLIAKEKYYVAVQTLYLPDWSTRLAYLRDWYKYRKVVVVNPANGKAIVADVADSGPAWWTGKSFGGSPDVMTYLQMQDGRQRGAVVLFFVDDPANHVPLGPLEQNINKGPALLTQV